MPMRVPVSWLREFVDFDATPEELAEKLTFSGVEVEKIERIGGSFEGIVVGEILGVEPHPGADRLSLCRVSDGKAELRVVCGAPNARAGAKVPFAPIGTTLPGGLKIRRAKIRGEESFGMLCAEDELGISDDHSGLMLLPPATTVGKPLSEVLGPAETVLHLEITWNRPDCLSILGMAREVAALYRRPLKMPAVRVAEGRRPIGELVKVTIEAPDGCPRYTARALLGTRIAPSPAWMQKRLTLCGVRPINNIVDVTNYVMLECGQPLHAFDAGRLEGAEIRVRRAAEGERLTTLDGVQRTLTPAMLVIADAHRPVALAGIMGGEGSEIEDDTETVLIESACFAPAGIHRTSVELGHSTESAHRFERGVDMGGAAWAADRAAALMAELGGGELAAGLVDVYPGRAEPRRLWFGFDAARALLGMDISDGEMTDILESLQFRIVDRRAGACRVEAPGFRYDIELEADLIEEVARMHGLDKAPESDPVCRVVAGVDDEPFRAETACRTALVGLGLCEALHYSFLAPGLLDLFDRSDSAARVALPNPVSADHAVLRNSLIPQMTQTLGHNLARQAARAGLFEIGKIFTWDGAAVAEEARLCIGLLGPFGRGEMDLRKPVTPEECFLWMKGIVAELLAVRGVGNVSFQPADAAFAEAGSGVRIAAGGAPLGVMGLLRADLRREWRMHGPVALCELAMAPLLAEAFRVPAARPIPAYPAVSRDVAMVVDDAATHEKIVATIRHAAPPELTSVELFDIFKSEGMGHGRKSVAYSIEFRSMERSLTDEEANRHHEAIKKALREELKAELREN